MSQALGDVFADTVFWLALVSKADQYHAAARGWSQRVSGHIVTTDAVLTETANALARPAWRPNAVSLMESVLRRDDVKILGTSGELWTRGWKLYQRRPDKGWGLTDCISFVAMWEAKLIDALTADAHFTQAGFRAVLLEDVG